eukprot:scaffold8539_cov582-Pinguiococcus_pyrenoidosus.AAC.1
MRMRGSYSTCASATREVPRPPKDSKHGQNPEVVSDPTRSCVRSIPSAEASSATQDARARPSMMQSIAPTITWRTLSDDRSEWMLMLAAT